MKPAICYLVGSVLAGTFASPVIAWDACGHKTVATIAEHGPLTPQAAAAINAIIQNDPRHRSFVDSATWPDDIKQGRNNSLIPKAPINRSWHFVDIPFNANPQQIETITNNNGVAVNPQVESSANVVTAIRFFRDFLKSGTGTPVQKADALSWLIHLVGDVHQPLHCMNVEVALPNYNPPSGGDKGGNGFALRSPAKELHALWDDAFDEPNGGRHDEGRDDSDEHATEMANRLLAAVHPSASLLAVKEPAVWAKESYAHHIFAYSLPLDPTSHAQNPTHTLTPAYASQMENIAAERAVLAGKRLATMLNDIFTPHP